MEKKRKTIWHDCPKVKASFEGEELIEGVDYAVAYEDNSEPGIATIYVTEAGV